MRPCTEADLPRLASISPGDAEQDPQLPRHVDDDAATREHRVLQSYWRGLANWTAQKWQIDFVVRKDGESIGVQTLEANDFPRLRLVETASWLTREHRGEGVGKEMRAAVLHFAFEGLGALAAETEAWHDNDASLGVSAALGYEPNGETLHLRGDKPDRMVRLRLPRASWAVPVPVEIKGLDRCRQFFQI